MEKVSGSQLSEAWDDIKHKTKMQLIKRLTEYESELASIEFPAYGSLYLRSSLPAHIKSIPLDVSIDPAQIYCIGPSCERDWESAKPGNSEKSVHPSQRRFNQGPCQ